MILQAVLVAYYLAVQLVYQLIHRSVQVFVRTLCKHVAAFDVDIALGTLPSLFFLLLLHGEEYLDIDYLVKVPHDSI